MKNREKRERRDAKNVESHVAFQDSSEDLSYDEDLFDAEGSDSIYDSSGGDGSDPADEDVIYVGLGSMPVKKRFGDDTVRYVYSEIDSEPEDNEAAEITPSPLQGSVSETSESDGDAERRGRAEAISSDKGGSASENAESIVHVNQPDNHDGDKTAFGSSGEKADTYAACRNGISGNIKKRAARKKSERSPYRRVDAASGDPEMPLNKRIEDIADVNSEKNKSKSRQEYFGRSNSVRLQSLIKKCEGLTGRNLKKQKKSKREIVYSEHSAQLSGSENETGRAVKITAEPKHFQKGIAVSEAPFVTCGEGVRRIMLDVIVAMLPSLIWAVYVFGFRIITVTAVSAASCFLSELWFEYLVRRRITVGDLSAVSEGIMLALLMPASVPLWIPVVAGFFGTVFVKCLFGGQGRNIFKPSLAGFAFVSVALKSFVSGYYTEPMSRLLPFAASSDTGSVFYPLSDVCGEVLPMYSYGEMFMGLRPGAVGEISVLMILLGAAYLILRHIISWRIPVCYVLSCAVIFSAFSMYPGNRFMVTEVFCSLVPVCAVFFASDFSAAPVFGYGKIIFGVGCGVVTAALRYAGAGIYSPVYAVLIMELLSRPLDFLSAWVIRIGLTRRKRGLSDDV